MSPAGLVFISPGRGVIIVDLKRSFSLTEAELGVWVEIDGEECFRLRSPSAPEFQEAIQDYLSSEEAPTMRKAREYALSRAGIVEWRGLTIGGKEIPPYTPELAEKILADWPKLARRLERECNALAVRAQKEQDEASGNSGGSSDGGPPTASK